MNLTGRKRYRIGFRGVVILQVEERYRIKAPFDIGTMLCNRWRDARAGDLSPEAFGALDPRSLPDPSQDQRI